MKKVLSVLISVMMIASALSLLSVVSLAENSNVPDSTLTIATNTDASNVETSKIGDANADGKVTVVDAKWILQNVADLRAFSVSQKTMCDVNNDGKISVVDAKLILKAVAGISELPSVIVGSDDILGDDGYVDI